MKKDYTPHISETAPGKYIIIYGEEILGEFTNIRRAIEKCGNTFTFTANTNPHDEQRRI